MLSLNQADSASLRFITFALKREPKYLQPIKGEGLSDQVHKEDTKRKDLSCFWNSKHNKRDHLTPPITGSRLPLSGC